MGRLFLSSTMTAMRSQIASAMGSLVMIGALATTPLLVASAQAHMRGMYATKADAEKRAAMVGDEIKANAQAEAARIIAQAKADAEQQVNRAREELRSQVAGLAVKGAEQILKREVNAAAHADLLNQLATEL